MVTTKNFFSVPSINWDRASTLFSTSDVPKTTKHISAKSLLFALARSVDEGLQFLMSPNPVTVARLLQQGASPLPWDTKQRLNRFQKQNYVTIRESSDGTITVHITKHGLERALSYKINDMHLQAPEAWDGKWRVIIFDVPERYKRFRDLFRMRLKQLGLYGIQDSVFVSPYSCFKEVEFLRELYGIAFTVRYLLVEKIEEDASLRTHFAL